jgi:hypothetical protein
LRIQLQGDVSYLKKLADMQAEANKQQDSKLDKMLELLNEHLRQSK